MFDTWSVRLYCKLRKCWSFPRCGFSMACEQMFCVDIKHNFWVAAGRSSVVLYIVRVSISTWQSKAESFKMSMESALIYMEISVEMLFTVDPKQRYRLKSANLARITLNTHVFQIWLTSSPKKKLQGKRFWKLNWLSRIKVQSTTKNRTELMKKGNRDLFGGKSCIVRNTSKY